MKYSILTVILIVFIMSSCSQRNEIEKLGKKHAESELKAALNKLDSPNAIDNSRIILKDSVTAISIAEPILFEIYGKKSILKQKPYETYLIDKYWVIFGTLRRDVDGGVFLIIIDATNSRILKVSHGK